jgi:hypothetical protein
LVFENPRTAVIDYDNWGDENDPTSDWNLLQKKSYDKLTHRMTPSPTAATMIHTEACEFILWIGSEEYNNRIWELRKAGYSRELIKLAIQARRQGFYYLWLYAG